MLLVRIAHGSEAVTLLIEDDYDVAIEKTKKVQQNNTDRKTLDKDITEEAFAMIDNNEALIHQKIYCIVSRTLAQRCDWHCCFALD
jgi:single-stranded DNA-specific DHH superfamily exonuclease